MPTFPEWDRIVLEHTYENVDYLSLHTYLGNTSGDIKEYLAESVGMELFIREVGAICDFVKAKKRGKKDIKLSFDEWNVWFHSHAADEKAERWGIAPPLLEDIYDMSDALVVGTMLNALIRNADRVKVACLAQLVNVIAPIMTRTSGPAWRQTIYWPFLHVSIFGRGLSLCITLDSPKYDTVNYGDVPVLDVSAVLDEKNGDAVVFCVNRSLTDSLGVSIDLNHVGTVNCLEHIVLRSDDLSAANTEANPCNVVPAAMPVEPLLSGVYECILPATSWNLLRFKLTKS
jgi:alpha-N-arabinofuranosidase